MTTLLSEIFAEMEVIFVDEANPRNFQMSGDSFLQMRPVSVLVVSFLYVCGVYVGVRFVEGRKYVFF